MPYPYLSADAVLTLYDSMDESNHPFVDEPTGDATAAVFLPFVNSIPPLVEHFREHGGPTGYAAAVFLLRSVVAQLPDRDGPVPTMESYLRDELGIRGEEATL